MLEPTPANSAEMSACALKYSEKLAQERLGSRHHVIEANAVDQRD
ncbi:MULTISPECIES: hypothetical protein [unclassified Pseudomonas]|nr:MULTISPECIES: hypothetical protein [unclassified Pseudomonas]